MNPSTHHTRGITRCLAAALALTGLAVVPVQSEKTTRTSSAAVGELVKAMNARQLTAIAARDPAEPDRYVAAMLFPGVQLLVITARTQAPDYLEAQLAAKAYGNAYGALQQGIADSKLFVQDMGGDGLRGADGGTADVVYSRGKDTRILDGDHKAARMSASNYRKLVSDLDRKYTDMLRVLIGSLRDRQESGLPASR